MGSVRRDWGLKQGRMTGWHCADGKPSCWAGNGVTGIARLSDMHLELSEMSNSHMPSVISDLVTYSDARLFGGDRDEPDLPPVRR